MENSANAREVASLLDKLCLYYMPTASYENRCSFVQCLIKIILADLKTSIPDEDSKLYMLVMHKGTHFKSQ
jgi:hypothetical protein